MTALRYFWSLENTATLNSAVCRQHVTISELPMAAGLEPTARAASRNMLHIRTPFMNTIAVSHSSSLWLILVRQESFSTLPLTNKQ